MKATFDRASSVPRLMNLHLLAGDLNRMERGYTGQSGSGLVDPEDEHRDDMLQEVADATGVELENCRKVLKYVFYEHR